LYEQAEDTLFKMGVGVSQAITMLFRRVVMEQRLPFTSAVVKSLDLTDPADVNTFCAQLHNNSDGSGGNEA
jgi:addiction module RelB/DinJ family antitoxin